MRPEVESLIDALQSGSPVEMLDEICEYLRGEGAKPGQLHRLIEFMGALDDIANGKQNALLPRKRKNGQKAPAIQSMFATAVAATVTLLQRQGHSKGDAAVMISKRLKESGQAVSPTKILTWHRQIGANRTNIEGLNESYWVIVRRLTELTANTHPDVNTHALLENVATLPH